MNRALLTLIALLLMVTSSVMARVTPVDGGYQVSYAINLYAGSSNGSNIQDVLIFEWNEGGDFNVDSGFTIAGHGRTLLSHVIDFEPTSALVMGWGAGVPGVGDEKDHLFTLSNSSFLREATGQAWSAVFPGVPPEPRIGHNAMIGLLQAAAGGDADALAAVGAWVEREASGAAFDPAGRFRVMEWSIGVPIDGTAPVPSMTLFGIAALMFALLLLARRFIRLH